MDINDILNKPKFSGYDDYLPLQHLQGVSIGGQLSRVQLKRMQNFRKPSLSVDVPYDGPIKEGFNYTGLGNALGATIAFGGDLYNGAQYENTSADLLQNAGRSNSSINGVGYELQNSVDSNREMQLEHRQNVSNTAKSTGSGIAAGAAIGSIVPGIGTAVGAVAGGIVGLVGGLFGSGKRHAKARRAIREANEQANRTNNFNRDVAMTTGMQLDFNQKYGNTEDQVLYAKHGKDMNKKGKTIGFGAVETAEGLKNGPQNAWVSAGEGIYNPSTGYARLITHGQNDTAKANLKAEDVVFGDLKNPETGKTFKKDAAQYILAKENLNKKRPKTNDETTLKVFEATSKPIADALDAKLQDLAKVQERTRAITDYTGMLKAKHGKNCFPGFKLGGWLDNAIPSGLGMLTGVGQYFDARNQDVYRPNTYVRNPYETRALADLNSLRVSPYPIMRQLRDAEARGRYQIANSGGLSGAQRYLANVAMTANTQSNIANTLAQIQQTNLGYRSAADQAMLSAGAQDAANRMNALRADNDVYMRSHAARQQGMQMGIQNFMAALQQYSANEYKRRMGNATIDLYSSDLRNKSKK